MSVSQAAELLRLSHELGSPRNDWAILGEGNASARIDGERFVVKASGAKMAELRDDQVATLLFEPLCRAVSSDAALSDGESAALLQRANTDPSGPVPSVESLFHADLLRFFDAEFIGHTHITSVGSLVCSDGGWELLTRGGRLFPDEAVVCGPAACCVEYADPGLPLARAIHKSAAEFVARYRTTPKTIYLRSHGFIAIGASADEVLAVTQMADKSARIAIGAMACGAPRFLGERDVARILERPDEHHRRRALGLSDGGPMHDEQNEETS